MVTGEIAEVLKGYGVLNVTGDNYAGEWPVASFRTHGIAYERCEKSKSEMYLAFVPVTNSGDVELPDDKRLLTELRRLERKRGRAGKDSVDHPPRLHDDLANSVAGVSYVLQGNAKAGHQGFNPLLHVAPKSLRLVEGDWPLFVGLSSGDRIVATVLGQPYNAELRVLAAFVSEGSSVQGHLLQHTKPWMIAHAGSLRILGSYEDTTDVKIKAELCLAAQTTVGGTWACITAPAGNRRDAMLNTLTQAMPFTFRPALQIDPAATFLSRALNRPYEKEQRERKDGNYHVVNAFTLSRLEFWKIAGKAPKPKPLPPSPMSA